MRVLCIVVAIVVVLWAAACKERGHTVERGPCSGPARLELRKGDGALELRLVDAPTGGGPERGIDVCDAGGQRIAGLSWQGESLRLVGRNGQEQLRVADAQAGEVLDPSGQALRLFRAEPTLRVLKPDGVPYGSLNQGAGAVIVSDAAGSPVAKVTARDADAVLTAADGSTRGYVVPSPGLTAAAAFALPELPIEQRAFLVVHLGRKHLQAK